MPLSLYYKANKSNTMVIMETVTSNSKVNDFIKSNNIITLLADPTKDYVKTLNNTFNTCIHLFDLILQPINAHVPQFT